MAIADGPLLDPDNQDEWPELIDEWPVAIELTLEELEDLPHDDGDAAVVAIGPANDISSDNIVPRFDWGAYHFTKVKRSNAWQIECYFHRRNAMSGCRKTLTFAMHDAPTLEEAERRCLIRLKYWAASHSSYSRQWRHLLFHPEYNDCPDADLLELMKGHRDDRPAVTQTDFELDELEALLEDG